MFIDTRNRNPSGNVTRGGPVPASAHKTQSDFSPLMECPCTDRMQKTFTEYGTVDQGRCPVAIGAAQTCFDAAVSLGLRPITRNATVNLDTVPAGCTVQAVSGGYAVVYNTNSGSHKLCGGQPANASRTGVAESLVTLRAEISPAQNLVHLTLVGPADVWFGVGFNATAMNGAYAIVVLGDGTVQERRLGDHMAGNVLPVSVKVVNNTVSQGLRTVELVRPLAAPAFTFHPNTVMINFINAVGSSADFGYHKAKATDSLYLVGQGGERGGLRGQEEEKNERAGRMREDEE